MGKLLDNDYDLDVDLDIPDNLFGPDGDINMDFEAEEYVGARMHHANSAPVHSPRQADAARSVLASMDSAQLGEQSIHMHHAHSAPTHVFQNVDHFAHQIQQLQQVQHVQQVQQPIYIRDQSGNFIQITATIPVTSMNGPAGQSILSGVPFHPSQSAGEVKYHVQQSSMVPSNDPFQHFMPTNECASVQNSPSKAPGKKRGPRKRKGVTETVQQQRVRADKGYTEHPKTSEYLRHGEALKAYTKDNKEIPAIKDIFAVFAKNEGFSRSPPPVINIQARAGGSLCSNLMKQQLESEQRAEAAGRVKAERSNAIGVSRDEWSLFWKAHVERPARTGGKDKDCADCAGDERDAAGPESTAGDKPEAIFCGEYPSIEQAARAYDIMAIKIHGENTELNFPVDQYKAILPVVNSHTEGELLNAVLKDAELAAQRTSKLKGVRKTGPNHFEAAVDTDMVKRALDQNAKSEEKAAAAAKLAGQAPSIHHCTNTFNA